VRISLRYRLFFPLIGLMLLDLVVTTWSAWDAAQRVEVQIEQQLQAVIRTLSEPPTYPLTKPVLEKMKQLSGAEFVLARKTGEIETTFPTLETATSSAEVFQVGGESYRVLSLTLPDVHPNSGSTLSVCYAESLRRLAVRRAIFPPLVLGAAVACTALALFVLGTRVVGRIRQQRQQTQAITAGDFRTTPLPRPDDELQELASDVNDLAVRLHGYERELKTTERLRLLGQFSGGLAHQLRNAAGGAKLAVQLYLSEHPTGDREALHVALRQLARIESNLSQFLSLGKPPALVLQPLDLVEVLQASVELYRPQCKHARIVLSYTASGPVRIQGDAVQLGHLFANLIGNAVEASGVGGRVDVSCHPISSTHDSANHYLVEVRDTGPGLPPDIAERLFEPFVTGKEHGIGLGLAVAKQVAQAHGTQIEWLREEQQTLFRVQFSV
jgi:signal transduction histidine kinase